MQATAANMWKIVTKPILSANTLVLIHGEKQGGRRMARHAIESGGKGSTRRASLIMPVVLVCGVLCSAMALVYFNYRRNVMKRLTVFLDADIKALSLAESAENMLLARLQSAPWEERWYAPEHTASGEGRLGEDGTYSWFLREVVEKAPTLEDPDRIRVRAVVYVTRGVYKDRSQLLYGSVEFVPPPPAGDGEPPLVQVTRRMILEPDVLQEFTSRFGKVYDNPRKEILERYGDEETSAGGEGVKPGKLVELVKRLKTKTGTPIGELLSGKEKAQVLAGLEITGTLRENLILAQRIVMEKMEPEAVETYIKAGAGLDVIDEESRENGEYIASLLRETVSGEVSDWRDLDFSGSDGSVEDILRRLTPETAEKTTNSDIGRATVDRILERLGSIPNSMVVFKEEDNPLLKQILAEIGIDSLPRGAGIPSSKFMLAVHRWMSKHPGTYNPVSLYLLLDRLGTRPRRRPRRSTIISSGDAGNAGGSGTRAHGAAPPALLALGTIPSSVWTNEGLERWISPAEGSASTPAGDGGGGDTAGGGSDGGREPAWIPGDGQAQQPGDEEGDLASAMANTLQNISPGGAAQEESGDGGRQDEESSSEAAAQGEEEQDEKEGDGDQDKDDDEEHDQDDEEAQSSPDSQESTSADDDSLEGVEWTSDLDPDESKIVVEFNEEIYEPTMGHSLDKDTYKAIREEAAKENLYDPETGRWSEKVTSEKMEELVKKTPEYQARVFVAQLYGYDDPAEVSNDPELNEKIVEMQQSVLLDEEGNPIDTSTMDEQELQRYIEEKLALQVVQDPEAPVEVRRRATAVADEYQSGGGEGAGDSDAVGEGEASGGGDSEDNCEEGETGSLPELEESGKQPEQPAGSSNGEGSEDGTGDDTSSPLEQSEEADEASATPE